MRPGGLERAMAAALSSSAGSVSGRASDCAGAVEARRFARMVAEELAVLLGVRATVLATDVASRCREESDVWRDGKRLESGFSGLIESEESGESCMSDAEASELVGFRSA